ncbi:Ger(x)C family spore germination protein [Virgibacillus siamensis]|uniref:Ger(x)C family spore germination protein n=1 Tax=Virgibacillus siamensis TaxID=480071 RepID=UPI00098480D9|nr:Ger(x)C family spore germination protein [Virgibacillus siamensis]
MKQICIAFLLIFLLSGCWDRTEVNDLAIVAGTGLDKTEDGNILLSVQIINPKASGSSTGGSSGGQTSGNLATVREAVGKTIFDAKSKLQEQVPRKLFWGHNRAVIIGPKMAEQGIRKHIDFFARHPFPRLRAFTFMTTNNVTDVLKVMPALERSSSEVMREISKIKVGMSVTTKDLLNMLQGKATSTALPIVEVIPEPLGTEGLRISGTAIFNNAKMVGQIDDKLTRGILWLRDAVDTASVTIQPKGVKGNISFHLLRSTTKLIPKIENGKWKIIAQIKSLDDAVENETKLDLMNPDIVNKLEKQLAQAIEERIRLVLKKVQKEMKADVFTFSDAFHRHYPKKWKKVEGNWEEKFPEVQVVIQCNVDIKRPGRSTAPEGVPPDEVIGK